MKGGIISTILMRGEDGKTVWSGVFMVYIMPLLAVTAFYFIMKSSFQPEEHAGEIALALEIKNDLERKRMDAWLRKTRGKKPLRKWE